MELWKVARAAVGLVTAVAVLTACRSETTEGQRRSLDAEPSTSAASPVADVVAALRVPDGNKLVATMDATGVQVYQCADGAWKPLEPAAVLSENGTPTALHSRGPVWVSTADGSAVSASPVPGASAPRPNAVPELQLKATTVRGTGVFGRISYVQRLKTEGGVAPSQACTADEHKAVPYKAVYTFYAPAR